MDEAEADAFLAVHSKIETLSPGSWHQIGIADKTTNRLVGDLGIWLSHDSSTAEFGVSIARAHQGRGYGSETAAGAVALLFDNTPAVEVLAHADERNTPCLKALERAGMSLTSTRQETYKGELCVENCFRVSREMANSSLQQAARMGLR
jgi:RimJ/RimL family protein N-acetyltransferase